MPKLVELLEVKYQYGADVIWVVQTCADGIHWHPDYYHTNKGSCLEWLKINDIKTYKECTIDIGQHSKIFAKEHKPPVVIEGEMQYEMMHRAEPSAEKPKKRNWVGVDKINTTPLKELPKIKRNQELMPTQLFVKQDEFDDDFNDNEDAGDELSAEDILKALVSS
jgi:hypothetical protein